MNKIGTLLGDYLHLHRQTIPGKFRAEYKQSVIDENVSRFRSIQFIVMLFLLVMVFMDIFNTGLDSRLRKYYLIADVLLLSVTVCFFVHSFIMYKKKVSPGSHYQWIFLVYGIIFFSWVGFISSFDFKSVLGFPTLVSCIFFFSSFFILSLAELFLLYAVSLLSLFFSYWLVNKVDPTFYAPFFPTLVIYPVAFMISRICRNAAKKRFLDQKKITEINEDLQVQIFEKQLLENKMKKAKVELEAKVEDKLLDLLRINETLYDEIKERKRIEEDLIVARDRAQESDKLKTSFLANISHEIRTPMNAIIGFSSLLQKEKGISEHIDQYIEIIDSNSHKIIDLIENIIDLAQLDAGISVLEKNQYPVNTLIHEVIDHYNPAVEKEITINFSKKDSNDLIIYTDTIKLRKILTQLLDNAVKFSSKKGTVEMGYSFNKNCFEFFVKDKGIGISEEYHDKIFEAFVQEDSSDSRKYGGTGLGLTIIQRFIHLLGGEIKVQSKKEEGSTFSFTIHNQ